MNNEKVNIILVIGRCWFTAF